MKILIVDDSMQSQLLLELYLKKLDFSSIVFKAQNGQEALNIINNQEEDFDLILIDIRMPVMSGYEFAEIYKGKAVIVATTGLDPYQFDEMKLFHEILIKPISFQVFKETVEKVISHKTLS